MEILWEYREQLWRGLIVTVSITATAAVVTMVLALVLGGLASARAAWIARPTRILIEVFRGIPALAQLFWLFFVLPQMGIRLSPFFCGVLGLSLCFGAYGGEIVRGAVSSFGKGQREAAIALNFPRWRYVLSVMAPQLIVTLMPMFGNLMIELLKASSLVSLITMSDLTFQAKSIMRIQLNSTEVLVFLVVAYFLLARVISLGTLRLERLAGGTWRGRG